MGRKHCARRRNCSLRAISPFPTVLKKKKEKKLGLVWERLNDYEEEAFSNQ